MKFLRIKQISIETKIKLLLKPNTFYWDYIKFIGIKLNLLETNKFHRNKQSLLEQGNIYWNQIKFTRTK